MGFGPCLTVDIHHGALTEGFLTFSIVMISVTKSFWPYVGNGMGLCSRGSYNQGAYTCLLACPNGGNSTGSLDIPVAGSATQGGERKNEG